MDENHAVNSTRVALHRVATHVLARARFAATGKFGLRATPGGFGTPAFGSDLEVIRIAGPQLVRERGGRETSMPLNGATLRALALFVDADLDAPFEAGHDTPDMGDPDGPLVIEAPITAELADWLHIGWQVLDAGTADARDAMAIQLWPEHFDAGTSVAIGDGENDRCNLGASLGDGFSAEPYLYVGPWGDARPGNEWYWNAPFGAVVRRSELLTTSDPLAAGTTFVRRGLDFLRGD